MATDHSKIGIIIATIYAVCLFSRGVSRLGNPTYVRYVDTFCQTDQMTRKNVAELKRKWDIDFRHWSVDYTAPASKISLIKGPGFGAAGPLCYLIGHTFARWMIYPGATPLLNSMLKPMVQKERQKLIESGAQRAKVIR